MSKSSKGILRDAHLNTFRHLLIAVSIVYVGLPVVFYFFPHPDNDVGGPTTTPPAPTSDTGGPVAATHPSDNPKPPLVRLLQESGISLAAPFKFLWAVITYFISNIARVASLCLLPFKHLIQLVYYSSSFVFRPLRFVLDPLLLALRILLAPIIAPLYGLFRLMTAFYPIYVFLAASCICGVVVGWGAKWVSIVAINSIMSMLET